MLYKFIFCYLFTLGSPRTNNHCEGWHNKINGNMGSHPNIFRFIHSLMQEQNEQETTMARIEAGHSPEARKKIYVKSDERLLKIVKDYARAESFLPYLKKVSHNITF